MKLVSGVANVVALIGPLWEGGRLRAQDSHHVFAHIVSPVNLGTVFQTV